MTLAILAQVAATNLGDYKYMRIIPFIIGSVIAYQMFKNPEQFSNGHAGRFGKVLRVFIFLFGEKY